MAETYRVLLYSHDSRGLGYVRHSPVIAHDLAWRLLEAIDADVVRFLVAELTPVSRFPLPEGFDWVTIPGVSKGRDGYRPRGLSGATSDLIKLRSRLLQAVLFGFKPDPVVIDRHIYDVWSELREPLMWLREQHSTVRAALRLREVLDGPRVAVAGWECPGDPGRLCDLVDKVWVYGDPAVHDPVAAGGTPPVLADCIRLTGYLANDRCVSDHGEPAEPKSSVPTIAGGGSNGHELLRTAVVVRAPTGYENIVVVRPQLDDASFGTVIAQAAPGTQVHRSWPGLGSRIVETVTVISMGGYDTVRKISATGTPVLTVPRETSWLRQLIRAEALRDAHTFDVMRTPQVTAETLGAWAAGAVTRCADRSHISRDGLVATTDFATDLLSDASPAVQEAVA